MIYKIKRVGNRKMYFEDGKMKSPKDIPEHILRQLENIDEVDTTPQLELPRICLYCRIPSRLTRLVNFTIVYLCDIHYQEMNIGKIAQRLRENEEKEKVPA